MKYSLKNLVKSVDLHLASEPDLIANLANISAMIFHTVEDLNWVGFYLVNGDTLILGPFQGKPACLRIKIGQGVCGEAFLYKKCIIVDDCHNYTNHIACDTNSKSEIVVPIIVRDQVKMVLDVDSPTLARFKDLEIVNALESIGELIAKFLLNEI